MKKANKILSVVLAVMMVISIISISASAATYSGVCGDNVNWIYDSSTYTLTISGTGDMYDFEYSNRPWESYIKKIKEVVISDGITSIGAYAFRGCYNVTMIAIPDSITRIGKYGIYACKSLTNIELSNNTALIDEWTFAYCESLTNITIPQGVTSIGDYAFAYCENLEDITISDSVTTIGEFVFYYCNSLKEIVIPDSVISIGEEAFSVCENLTTVKIPSSVTTIGQNAFSLCENLTTIIVDSANPYYSTDEYNSVLFNKDKTSLVFYLRKNPQTSYNIPDTVTTICNEAFLGCENLTSITIGKNVETIGNSAFNYCSGLTNLIIPDNVKIIGDKAFYNCFYLESVKIGNGVTSIGNSAFSFNEYLNPDEKLQLKELEFGNSVTTIGDYAFENCTLLTNVTIPDSVITIGESAFSNCQSLASINIGKNVTIIGNCAFYNCNTVTKIIIPDGVTTIEWMTFRECTNLKSVLIPDGVTSIGNSAFQYCNSLKDVYYFGTKEQWNNITIGNYNQPLLDATIHCNYHIHKYNSIVTEPTCTEQGFTTYTCECGDSYVDDYVDSLGHTPADAVEENYVVPTPTKNGSKDVVVYCSVCGVEISRESLVVKYDENRHFTGVKGDYFYKDDVRQKAYQLVEFEGDFYFINDSHKIAKNKTLYLSERFVEGFTYKDGTPLAVGYYEFDADGKMIIKNGVVGDYFYKNNERLKAYQLVEFEGNYYFINDSHKLAKNKTLYLSERFVTGFTYEDGTPLQPGYYTFDENGKMVMLDGPVGDYFYKDNVRLKAYQLIEYEGDIYFVYNSHKLAKNTRLYLSERFVEGTDLKVGYYEFDADGKLIIE